MAAAALFSNNLLTFELLRNNKPSNFTHYFKVLWG